MRWVLARFDRAGADDYAWPLVAEVADLGQLRMLTHTGWRGQRHAATAVQIFVGSVVLGQKTEFLRNLLPIFMQYVSE